MSATGISYLATAITEADVASGQIDHAIAIQIPRCNEFVYPADRHDCGSDPGQPAEGQWFRLPADLPMPAGLTPFAQMVFTALQRYGAVVTDFAGAVMMEAEEPSDWAEEGNSGTDPITASWDGLPEYKVVAGLPWSSLQAVGLPRVRPTPTVRTAVAGATRRVLSPAVDDVELVERLQMVEAICRCPSSAHGPERIRSNSPRKCSYLPGPSSADGKSTAASVRPKQAPRSARTGGGNGSLLDGIEEVDQRVG